MSVDNLEGKDVRIAKALTEGDTPVEAEDNQLLCDLGTPEAVKGFVGRLMVVAEFYPVVSVATWASRSPLHRHAVVDMEDDMDPAARFLLETILGSDPKRALYGLVLLERTGVDHGLLVRPKGAEIVYQGATVADSELPPAAAPDEDCDIPF